jgi:hypothetical protein
MDELINTLSQKTGLPEDDARIAMDTVVPKSQEGDPRKPRNHEVEK